MLASDRRELSKITNYYDVNATKGNSIIVKGGKDVGDKIKEFSRNHRDFINNDGINAFQVIF